MKMTFRFLLLYALLAGVGAYMSFHRDLVVPLARPFGEFPASLGGWRMLGQSSLSESIVRLLMPTDYLSRRYVDGHGTSVDMYLSYFDGGPDSGGIHSPKHCLPGSGWTELSSERVRLDLAGESVNMVRAVYAKGDVREVIFYWFAMRGKTMSDEYSLKLAEITGSMLHSRRDQSFVRISVQSTKDLDRAAERIEDFLRVFYPVIAEFLPS
jgi:EpsI family protein